MMFAISFDILFRSSRTLEKHGFILSSFQERIIDDPTAPVFRNRVRMQQQSSIQSCLNIIPPALRKKISFCQRWKILKHLRNHVANFLNISTSLYAQLYKVIFPQTLKDSGTSNYPKYFQQPKRALKIFFSSSQHEVNPSFFRRKQRPS